MTSIISRDKGLSAIAQKATAGSPCPECSTRMKRTELSSSFILEKCPQCRASAINGKPDWRTSAEKGISCLECGEVMDRIESRDSLTHITYEECPTCRASHSSSESCQPYPKIR